MLWVILSLLCVLLFGKLRVSYYAPFNGDFFFIEVISLGCPHGRACDVPGVFGENC